jgi:hypothetical protein
MSDNHLLFLVSDSTKQKHGRKNIFIKIKSTKYTNPLFFFLQIYTESDLIEHELTAVEVRSHQSDTHTYVLVTEASKKIASVKLKTFTREVEEGYFDLMSASSASSDDEPVSVSRTSRRLFHHEASLNAYESSPTEKKRKASQPNVNLAPYLGQMEDRCEDEASEEETEQAPVDQISNSPIGLRYNSCSEEEDEADDDEDEDEMEDEDGGEDMEENQEQERMEGEGQQEEERQQEEEGGSGTDNIAVEGA